MTGKEDEKTMPYTFSTVYEAGGGPNDSPRLLAHGCKPQRFDLFDQCGVCEAKERIRREPIDEY
jgi:hypothetical protein